MTKKEKALIEDLKLQIAALKANEVRYGVEPDIIPEVGKDTEGFLSNPLASYGPNVQMIWNKSMFSHRTTQEDKWCGTQGVRQLFSKKSNALKAARDKIADDYAKSLAEWDRAIEKAMEEE